MNERDLDRAIDAATRELMAREPSRALSNNVMARVRESGSPAPRRLVWLPAVAAAVLCVAIATVMMNRAPSDAVLVLPGAPPAAVGQPAIAALPPMTVAVEMPSARRNARAPIAARAASTAPPPMDGSPIAAIETEPIVLPTLDVPVLEQETAVIDVLTIESLTIEPLAASND